MENVAKFEEKFAELWDDGEEKRWLGLKGQNRLFLVSKCL